MSNTLCDDWLESHPAPKGKQNPMLRRYGAGPDGKKCKTCRHLYCKEFAGRYYKCDLRGDTNGAGTDHRVNWPACGRHEEE